METLSVEKLRKVCPVKWHKDVPKDGISMGVADIDFAGPEGVIDYIKANLSDDFSFYQDQQGLPNTIDIINTFLTKKGIPVDNSMIQVIEGTMMGIQISMKWIGSKEGDILSLGPIYPPIHGHASSEGNQIKWIDIKEGVLNVEELQEKIDQTCKMILMCNPNNPTGYVYKPQELKLIRDLAIDYNTFIFADELYEPLVSVPHTSIASLEGAAERSILLYGFSKAYGLAGYRAGFMYVGANPEELRLLASQQMVSPSPIASLVTNYALTSSKVKSWVKAFNKEIQQRLTTGSNFLAEHEIPCKKPEGSFFLFPKLEGIDDVQFAETLLMEEGVQVIPGSYFGPMADNHIRINCATSESRMMEGLRRMIKHYRQQ